MKAADKNFGENNYYLGSLYVSDPRDIMGNDFLLSDDDILFVIDFVPKTFEKQFIEYRDNTSLSSNLYTVKYRIKNKHIIEIDQNKTYDGYEKFVEGTYANLVAGLKYEEKIKNYFLEKYPFVGVRVWYNPYFSTHSQFALIDSDNSLFSDYIEQSTEIEIFIPYEVNVNDFESNLRNDINDIIDLGIKGIEICQLKEGVNIKELEPRYLSEFSDVVGNKKHVDTLSINRNLDL